MMEYKDLLFLMVNGITTGSGGGMGRAERERGGEQEARG